MCTLSVANRKYRGHFSDLRRQPRDVIRVQPCTTLPNPNHIILITAAGTGTAYAYVFAIRKHFPSVRVVTADTNPAHLVGGSCLADRHVVLPRFDPRTYGEHIEVIIAEERVTHYLPIIDPEILFATEHPPPNCTVMAPDVAFCRNACEKSCHADNFSGRGIEFPQKFLRTTVARRLPCWAKGNGGFGGLSNRLILNEDDIETVPDSWFFQEHVDGREFTVDCFPCNDGQTICSVRERLLVKAGVCTRAHLIRNARLEKIGEMLGSTMTRKSPFCFQAIERKDGSVAVTDINPRLGAGTALSVANGMEFFAAHLAGAFDANPLSFFNRRYSTCYASRQYTEFLSPGP